MTEYEVENKSGLAAAILAAAQPTFPLAVANPFTVSLIGTRFKVICPQGLTENRARSIARRVRRLSAAHFKAGV